MPRSGMNERITAGTLGLRDLPRAWRGATLDQMVNSARKVVEQAEAIGGSKDPRLPAALKILDFSERLRAEQE
jgi:hypothetical protein